MGHNIQRVLALSPHIDDIEFTAGATMARFAEEGKEIFYVAFSVAEKSIPAGFPKDKTEQEVKQAIAVLGIPRENLIIHKFEVRVLPQFRQEILEIMIKLRKEIRPDLVLMPSLKDMHQDHHVIAEEGFRAFKYDDILGYEVPWNLPSFEPSSFVVVQKRHLEKKMEAIRCYETQHHRHYSDSELIFGWARLRGAQVSEIYAEAFETVKRVVD